MVTPAGSPEIEAELSAKLMRGVGVCLFQYQQIEAYLKLLLPHMRHPNWASASIGGSVNWRELIDSKVTLGPLVEDFKRRTDAQDSEGFGGYLERLVEQRNDLVHHLLNDPSRPLRTDADAERAIEVLRQYIGSAAAFLQALRSAAAQFMVALDNSPVVGRHFASLEFPVSFERAP